MKTAIVIPARLASTRLKRKLLLAETGKPLIQHTYEAASQSQLCSRVVVATDHQDICDAVTQFGGEVAMTAADHQSGTDRAAEIAANLPGMDGFEIIVNVQGDEPEIPGEAIDLAVRILQDNPAAMVATLATPIRSQEHLEDPNCVKVVFDTHGRAMYFSRSPIPCSRRWDASRLQDEPANWFQHIGLYAYRRKFLLEFSNLKPTKLEEIESLEQLRILHAGHGIQVGVIAHGIVGIDTAKDYQSFVERQSN